MHSARHAVGKVFKWHCPVRCVVAAGRFELVSRLLVEAEEYLARGDAVQFSEKLYKVAEECVKALSERLGLPEAKEAEVKGGWTVALLERAVRRLAGELGVDVQLGWDAAGHLHVWGFHEAKLEVEDVEARIPLVKRLVELAEKTCTE
uniref:Superfamily I DNA and RNA helicase and helicaseubunit n=1 Tax=Thermofilum adornatum TaxID=1365176 RepID=A0A7C1GAM1_9CREN